MLLKITIDEMLGLLGEYGVKESALVKKLKQIKSELDTVDEAFMYIKWEEVYNLLCSEFDEPTFNLNDKDFNSLQLSLFECLMNGCEKQINEL